MLPSAAAAAAENSRRLASPRRQRPPSGGCCRRRSRPLDRRSRRGGRRRRRRAAAARPAVRAGRRQRRGGVRGRTASRRTAFRGVRTHGPHLRLALGARSRRLWRAAGRIAAPGGGFAEPTSVCFLPHESWKWVERISAATAGGAAAGEEAEAELPERGAAHRRRGYSSAQLPGPVGRPLQAVAQGPDRQAAHAAAAQFVTTRPSPDLRRSERLRKRPRLYLDHG